MTEYRHVVQPAAQEDKLDSSKSNFTPREAALIAKIREIEDTRIALLLENQRLQFKYNETKHAHREWQVVFDLVNDLLFMYDKSYRIIRANHAYAERAGMTVESMAGKPYWEVFPKTSLPLPEHQPGGLKTSKDNTGEEVWLDNGEVFLSKSFPVYGEAEEYLYTMHVLRDISRQKHAEKAHKRSQIALKIFGECMREMVQAEDEPKMVQAACRTLVEKAGYRLAWICHVGEDRKSMTHAIFFGHRSEHLETYDAGLGMENKHNPAGMVIQAGTPFIAQNIINNPHFAFWRKDAARNGYASILGLPLRDKGGYLLGALCIYAAEPFAFEAQETQLLTALAANIAFGITAFRMRAEGSAAAHRRELYLSHMRDSLEDIIGAITKTIDLRNPRHSDHASQVAELARFIAMEMGLSKEQARSVYLAGILHDIGELLVPSEILDKRGKLTKEESSLMQNHARLGYDMLKEIDFPWPIAEIVLQHHERLDGSGYPQGLKGEGILLEARIIGVAEAIVSLVSSYRRQPNQAGLDIPGALAEVEKHKGEHYAPAVVDAALRLFREKGFRLF